MENPPSAPTEFGSALGTAGDYNGDGIDDVWVGAVRDTEDAEKRGKTVIYSGKSGAELAVTVESPLRLGT